MNDIKTITIDIVVPVLNEEKYLTDCLDSIIKFIKPENVDFFIYIVDGMSTDETYSIANSFTLRYNNIRLIKNPQKIQSCALNLVVENGIGEYLLRLDAHAKYPEDYLLNCYKVAKETDADNTGGMVVTLKGGNTYEAAVVQAMTTHKFGVGNSAFRTSEKVGEADTVPFGFFKKSIFLKIGLFDERLIRCQDFEFNSRIIKNGGKIWMNSKIYSEYYNQPTLFKFYSKQLFKEAPFNPYMWYLAPYSFTLRHAITGVFSTGIILGILMIFFISFLTYIFIGFLILYFILSLISSIQLAVRFKKLTFIIILPFCFFSYHFLHGIGVLIGIYKLLMKKSPVQQIKFPWNNSQKFYSLNTNHKYLPKIF
jgi:glycosyltransferase involved in cell wall biosynthesis